MRNRLTRSVAVAIACTGFATISASAATIYTGDVTSGSGWTTGTGKQANSDATYNFDYSTLGIPLAPGTSTTTAIKLRANTSSTGAAAGGITLSPTGLNLTGDYHIEAQVWMNTFGTFNGVVSAGSGSTQFFGMGTGYTSGTNWKGGTVAAPVGGGSGTWFATDNEGGFSNSTTTGIKDYNAFIGSGATGANWITASSAYAASGTAATTAQDNVNGYYSAAFPTFDVAAAYGGVPASTQNAAAGSTVQTGNFVPGAIGFSWRTWTIDRTGSTIVWSIDGKTIATLTPSNGTLSLDGTPSLTYFDANAGVSGFPDLNTALVASYVVSTPEPSSIASGVLVLGGILMRRRRASAIA